MGMTREEYWELDPYLVRAFQQAHNLTIERRNQELWLQGLYIYKAFDTVLHNAFKKKSVRAEKYIEEPIRITPLTEREKKEKIKNERKRAIAYFTRLAKQWKKDHGQEGD